MSCPCAEQAGHKTTGGIERENRHARRREQKIVLVDKGRESGETAAESGRDKEFHCRRHIEITVQQAINKTYEETSKNIDHESSPRENAGGVILDKLRQEIAGSSTKEAARTYYKNRFDHCYGNQRRTSR